MFFFKGNVSQVLLSKIFKLSRTSIISSNRTRVAHLNGLPEAHKKLWLAQRMQYWTFKECDYT
jgi:hypothetical protein